MFIKETCISHISVFRLFDGKIGKNLLMNESCKQSTERFTKKKNEKKKMKNRKYRRLSIYVTNLEDSTTSATTGVSYIEGLIRLWSQ